MPSLALLDIFRNDAHGLTTPLSVQMLQTALHDKAKGSPKFRFCMTRCTEKMFWLRVRMLQSQRRSSRRTWPNV
jgi:hypothetical protein